MTAVLRAEARAKVNLTLEVLGRRPDGYHDIASVMSTVSLCDELILRPSDTWQVTIDAPEPLRSELEGGDNLVRRAVVEFIAVHDGTAAPHMRTPNVWPPAATAVVPAHLHLVKRIPAAAGLGGGSSDAASTLRLLNSHLENCGRSRLSDDRLLLAAARVGSDVPFFIAGGQQHATGRGETLRRLPDSGGQWLVVLVPAIALERKTALMYGLLTPDHYSDGSRTTALADRMAAASSMSMSLADIDLSNAFEQVAGRAFPELSSFAQRLSDATGSPAHLSGAGPSLFALAVDETAARSAAAGLTASGLVAWAVHTVPGD
jgi:4-diphosphocytidyl-2-C-methyl-D-erythritol kinase